LQRFRSIGDEGATALVEAWKVNNTLAAIDRSHNSIGNEGATALAEAWKMNNTLTEII
jgi:hypothetical protein